MVDIAVCKTFSQGNPHLGLDNLKYFILDEADRMIEAAHYQDMWNILDKLRGAKSRERRRNLVYSATLLVSRRMAKQKTRTKSTSRQEVMGKHLSLSLYVWVPVILCSATSTTNETNQLQIPFSDKQRTDIASSVV